MPCIVDGIVHEHVVVGRSALENGLAAGHVRIEFREIAPKTPLWAEIYGSVKLPARPWHVRGRIRNAMEKNVIYAGEEKIVGRLFDVRKGGLEMLGQPGEGFGRSKLVTADVRGGGREFVHRDVDFLDRAKDLSFRNVRGGVDVHQIARRSVGLVAGETSVRVAPFCP